MQQRIKEIYSSVKDLHHEVISRLAELGQGDPKLSERVELCYALDRTEKLLDDMRKEVKKVRELRALAACVMIYQAESTSIKTTYCTATVKAQQFVKFPHKKHNNPEKYTELMQAIGVSDKVIEHEAVRFNWMGLKDLWTERQVEGLPMLVGVDFEDTYTEYTLGFRKNKEVDE